MVSPTLPSQEEPGGARMSQQEQCDARTSPGSPGCSLTHLAAPWRYWLPSGPLSSPLVPLVASWPWLSTGLPGFHLPPAPGSPGSPSVIARVGSLGRFLLFSWIGSRSLAPPCSSWVPLSSFGPPKVASSNPNGFGHVKSAASAHEPIPHYSLQK